jgi:hypothetical protein
METATGRRAAPADIVSIAMEASTTADSVIASEDLGVTEGNL